MNLHHHRGGQGEPLMLLHGIGSRHGIWEPLLDELQQGFDVIAPDLPGFGQSPMPPPGTAPGVASLCDLLTAWLRELGLAPETVHVAGNSLGGLIALELARRGAARSACALSPAGFATRPERWLAQGMLWLNVRAARALAPRADRILARPRAREALLAGFFAHPARVPGPAAAADLRAMADAAWFDATLPTIGRWRFPELREATVPVTIAWGTKDRLLLPRQLAHAREEIPGARFVRLEDCGHVPTWDDPATVARVIAQTAAGAGGTQARPAAS